MLGRSRGTDSKVVQINVTSARTVEHHDQAGNRLEAWIEISGAKVERHRNVVIHTYGGHYTSCAGDVFPGFTRRSGLADQGVLASCGWRQTTRRIVVA